MRRPACAGIRLNDEATHSLLTIHQQVTWRRNGLAPPPLPRPFWGAAIVAGGKDTQNSPVPGPAGIVAAQVTCSPLSRP